MTSGREAWLALTLEDAIEPELFICDPYHHLWDPSKRLLSDPEFREGFVILSFLPFVAWHAYLGGLIIGLIVGYIFRREERYFFWSSYRTTYRGLSILAFLFSFDQINRRFSR